MSDKTQFAERILTVYAFLIDDCNFSHDNAISMIKNALNDGETIHDEEWTPAAREAWKEGTKSADVA